VRREESHGEKERQAEPDPPVAQEAAASFALQAVPDEEVVQKTPNVKEIITQPEHSS